MKHELIGCVTEWTIDYQYHGMSPSKSTMEGYISDRTYGGRFLLPSSPELIQSLKGDGCYGLEAKRLKITIEVIDAIQEKQPN